MLGAKVLMAIHPEEIPRKKRMLPLQQWLHPDSHSGPPHSDPTLPPDSAAANLGQLVSQVEQIVALNQVLASCLAEPLLSQCQVIQWREPELVIQVNSSVWAMRIKYQLPEILAALRSRSSLNLASIKVRIRPVATVAAPQPARAIVPLSAGTAEHIQQLASSVSDERLQQSLHRLASRGRPQS